MPEWTFGKFGHGGDYNPDQWRHIPGIFEEDLRLMKASHCNLMSVGIFSWAALEPEEGVYDFDWLEKVLDGLHENGVSVLLATPSGARPAWMSRTYPEVLRVQANRVRNLHGERHNHCYTSPVYRKFVKRMNTALAERFGHHPAVVGWHISNEYGGECHCELCQNEFREFLKKKYKTLENLNQAWWTGFWAKTYTDWGQLESPAPQGEHAIQGLTVDWKRFVTSRTVDFMAFEIEPLRELTPHLPVTTNLMGAHQPLDYFSFKRVMDMTSYDAYPRWGSTQMTDEDTAHFVSFQYDLTRAILRKPWLLMESTPSKTNWQEICKPKRPGMHLLSSMQAVAHGADTVQYFQWRKSRGATEKLHGAVVDHVGHEHTRVFRDVTEVGQWLEKLAPVLRSDVPAKTAVIFDWHNKWAMEAAEGPRIDKQYNEQVMEHYSALRRLGADVDVIDSVQDFTPYRLVVAPMLYMVRPGVAERVEEFVKNGGTFVATYWTGIVDENDLCFLGGFPGPLKKVLGVWAEEIDALYPDERNGIRTEDGREYECGFLCDLIHAEGAEVKGVYTKDFYAGRPALTRNAFGEGEAWYVAARADKAFLDDFYAEIAARAGVELPGEKVEGVLTTSRVKDGKTFRFIMNFSGEEKKVSLPGGTDLITGEAVGGETMMKINEVRIIEVK